MSEFGSSDYSFEELIAETGACYLASHTGIGEKVFDNSLAYIQSWLKVFRGDPKFIVQASAQAQKAVDFILDQIKEYEPTEGN
ncbi:MAG: hypothetical protein GC180_11450 [Bacteroidetes bacterium]|nr:hypothetical protein [Bacteroidota bacterium]